MTILLKSNNNIYICIWKKNTSKMGFSLKTLMLKELKNGHTKTQI